MTTDDGFTRGEGEENVPIVAASYHGNERQNTEGLRVYDAWFQHKSENEIPKPRRQHHHRNGKSGRTGMSLVIFRTEFFSHFLHTTSRSQSISLSTSLVCRSKRKEGHFASSQVR